MSQNKLHQQQNYQDFIGRKQLKDLPFYRRHPRKFAVIGSSIGFLILFSKGFYDIFKPNSAEDIEKKLKLEKLKQLQLQETLK